MAAFPFDESFITLFGLHFALLAVRLGTCVVCCPSWLHSTVPLRMRVVLVGLWSFVLTATIPHTISPAAIMGSLPLLVGQELIVGIAMGFSVSSIVLAMHMIGAMLSRIVDMNFEITAETDDGTASAFGTWFRLLSVCLLVAGGGHRRIMEASCQLVTAMPPGIEWDMTSASATIVQLLQDCFSFALQAGSPLVVAVVAAGIIAATIARFVRHFATVVAGLNLGLISILIALFLLLPLYEILVTEKATDASEALSQVFHRTER